jgi:hypothetical protein
LSGGTRDKDGGKDYHQTNICFFYSGTRLQGQVSLPFSLVFLR